MGLYFNYTQLYLWDDDGIVMGLGTWLGGLLIMVY